MKFWLGQKGNSHLNLSGIVLHHTRSMIGRLGRVLNYWSMRCLNDRWGVAVRLIDSLCILDHPIRMNGQRQLTKNGTLSAPRNGRFWITLKACTLSRAENHSGTKSGRLDNIASCSSPTEMLIPNLSLLMHPKTSKFSSCLPRWRSPWSLSVMSSCGSRPSRILLM